jgi:serine/threonine protein kinase
MFNVDRPIDKGGYGKVFLISRGNNQYAMKQMSKAKILLKNSVESIMKELEILKLLSIERNKFIIHAHYAFQDIHNLYLVLDLLTGGDLRFHLFKHQSFPPEVTQFLIACIALALQACHKN